MGLVVWIGVVYVGGFGGFWILALWFGGFDVCGLLRYVFLVFGTVVPGECGILVTSVLGGCWAGRFGLGLLICWLDGGLVWVLLPVIYAR